MISSLNHAYTALEEIFTVFLVSFSPLVVFAEPLHLQRHAGRFVSHHVASRRGVLPVRLDRVASDQSGQCGQHQDSYWDHKGVHSAIYPPLYDQYSQRQKDDGYFRYVN